MTHKSSLLAEVPARSVARPQCSREGKLLHEMDQCRCCFPRSCSRLDVDAIPSRDIHLETVVRHDCRA